MYSDICGILPIRLSIVLCHCVEMTDLKYLCMWSSRIKLNMVYFLNSRSTVDVCMLTLSCSLLFLVNLSPLSTYLRVTFRTLMQYLNAFWENFSKLTESNKWCVQVRQRPWGLLVQIDGDYKNWAGTTCSFVRCSSAGLGMLQMGHMAPGFSMERVSLEHLYHCEKFD